MSTLNLTDPNLPEEGRTIIVNATLVQERVIVPRQRVIWYLHGWEGGVVIVVDRTSILLFDLDKRRLHTISTREADTPTYVMHQIFNVFTEDHKVGTDIHFSPPAAIQPVAGVPGERWVEVLGLSRVHVPTHNRMLAMRS